MKELAIIDSFLPEANSLLEAITEFQVTDFASSDRAVDAIQELKLFLKELEAQRDAAVRPRNEVVGQINNRAREIKAPIDALLRRLEFAVGAFQAEQRRLKEIEDRRIEAERRAEEERIAAEAQAQLDALEAEKEEADATMDPLFGHLESEDAEAEFERQKARIEEEAAEAKMRAMTTAATAKFDASRQVVKGVALVWDCELIDIDQVPVEYQSRELNKAAVVAMARAMKGKITIPGVRIFQKSRIGGGKSLYVTDESLIAEQARDRARITTDAPRPGRRLPGADPQPARRATAVKADVVKPATRRGGGQPSGRRS